MQGDFDAFLIENVKQAEAFGGTAEAIAELRSLCEQMKVAYAEGGRAAVARAALAPMPAEAPAAAAIRLAILHAEAGDLDAAFRHLDAAIARPVTRRSFTSPSPRSGMRCAARSAFPRSTRRHGTWEDARMKFESEKSEVRSSECTRVICTSNF